MWQHYIVIFITVFMPDRRNVMIYKRHKKHSIKARGFKHLFELQFANYVIGIVFRIFNMKKLLLGIKWWI